VLDYAVAGDQHGHGIGAHGSADGARCAWMLHGLRQFSIAHRPAGRNVEQRAPHRQLETGSLDMQRQRPRSLARSIRDAIDNTDLASRGRKLRPGDVLVLVRRRNAFVEKLVRALEAKNAA
jgi:ATP-dependent exoDNAse (exonuclease V) beta subunit